MEKLNGAVPEIPKTKYTLIINYPSLRAGGIERGLVDTMRHFMKEGHRVIWITTDRQREAVDFKGLNDNPGLEIVIWDKWSRLFGVPQIRFQPEERVIFFSCCAMHYVIGEALKRRAGTREFKNYCLLAHFTGEEYYPDGYMKTQWGKKFFFGFWQTIVKRMVANDCLRAFSLEHLEHYEAYYGVPIPEKKSKLFVPMDTGVPEFDEENTRRREQERQERFVITTCSRFEFPHKAYILGLVDSFRTLKQTCPQAILQIIGGGAGEQELNAKIAELPETVRKDILLTGPVSPDDLLNYYQDSHVIVGLAGSIAHGALSGIPSIVVRHYCNVCEAYGFFEDAHEKVLSEEPGEEITPWLERCVTMSPEEYLTHSLEGYTTMKKIAESAPQAQKDVQSVNFFVSRQPTADVPTLQTVREQAVGRILYVVTELKNRFEG